MRHALATLSLVPLVLACCFFGEAPAPMPAPTVIAPEPIAPPAPALPTREVPALGRQILITLPAGAPERAPAYEMAAIPGLLMADSVELGTEDVVVALQDLPCTPGEDLAAGAVAELARRMPDTAGHVAARPFALGDATLTAIELVPDVEIRDADTNTFVLAWLFLAIDQHVVLASARFWMLADGLETHGVDPARLAIAETALHSIRRGDTAFTAHLVRGTYGDLFDRVDAPEGWVARNGECCNEDPPYRSRYDAHVFAVRALGQPSRARISARTRSACTGVQGPVGTMLGRSMRWTMTPRLACWVERAASGDDDGVTWRVYGASPRDLSEALAIASTITRSSDE